MSLTDMPDDVLCTIFDKIIDIETIYNTGRSCKRFMHLMQNNIHKPIDDKYQYKFFVIYADLSKNPYAFLYTYIRPFLSLCNYSFTSTVYRHFSSTERLKISSIASSISDIDTELNKLPAECKTINEIQNNPVICALAESFDRLSEDAIKRIFDNVNSFSLILNDDNSPWRLVPNHFMNMNTFAGVKKFTISRTPHYDNNTNIRTLCGLDNIDFSPLVNVHELSIHCCMLSKQQLYDISNCKGKVEMVDISIHSLEPLNGIKQLSLNKVKIRDNNLGHLLNCDKLELHYMIKERHSISVLRNVKDLTITSGCIKKTDIFRCDKLSLHLSSIGTIKNIRNIERLILDCVSIKPEDYDTDEDNILFTSELLKVFASGQSYYYTIIQDLGKFANVKFLSLKSYRGITSEALCMLKNVYALELMVLSGEAPVISLKGLDNIKLLWIYQGSKIKFTDITSLGNLKFLSFQGYDIDEGTIQQLPSLVRYNYNVWKENVDTFDMFYERYLNGERW
jgi:hypothetical protein